MKRKSLAVGLMMSAFFVLFATPIAAEEIPAVSENTVSSVCDLPEIADEEPVIVANVGEAEETAETEETTAEVYEDTVDETTSEADDEVVEEATVVGESAGSEAYVKRMYEIALGRSVDEAGFTDWNNSLVNKSRTASDVAAGFFFSEEFKNKNLSNADYVTLLYKTMFGREADEKGYSNWMNRLGQGCSRESVFKGFTDSVEFQNLCNSYSVEKGTFTSDQYRDKEMFVTEMVVRYYTKLLGRDYDADGLEYWCKQYHTGQASIESIAAEGFLDSAEFKNHNYDNKEFTNKMYQAFLDREAEADGLIYWSGKLANGEVTRNNLAYGFTRSREFKIIKLGIGVNKSDSYKMVVSFGDSIAAGSGVPAEDTYQSMIANLYGAEVKNLGYGGFSYSSHNGGASLTTKLDEFPSSEDRCLVLIQAGTNDFTLNAPAGLTTSNGNATVSGALKEIVTTIKTKMPYSDIIILSPIKNSYG
nr:DUF4214 domain-containing protein [Lachnospiraceae bacterium]